MAKRGPKFKAKYDPFRRPDGTVDYNQMYKLERQKKKDERQQRLEENKEFIFANGTKSHYLRCPVCCRKVPLKAKLLTPNGGRVMGNETGILFVDHHGQLQRRFQGATEPGYTYYPVSAEYFYPKKGSLIKPDESYTPVQLKRADASVYHDFQDILHKTAQLFQ